MDTLTRPIVPPAPRVHKGDLPSWRLIWEITRNTIGNWPDHAFDDLIAHGRVLGIESILLSDPEGARHVLVTARECYGRPVAVIRPIRPLTGAGLLLAEGPAWRRQRRRLAPAFTPSSVDSLLPHFTAAAEALVRRLETSPTANLSTAFHDTALDAVLRSLFSMPLDSRAGGMADMVRGYITGPGGGNLFDGLARHEDDFPLVNRRRRRFQADWYAAVDAVIAARRREGLRDGPGDLLDMLLQARDPAAGGPLSDVEIRDECATMLFAGFETTSRLLFWACYLLTLDPFEQTRLRAEVAAFAPERVAHLDDLQNWPRLRNVLLETLRLYPSAPHLVRECVEADTLLGESVAPGTAVWISPWVMHRHRRLWEQPTAFVPERFAGQASPWTSIGAYMPFGGGPRICIGASFAMAEAQIVLASLLSRFEISLDSRRPVLPVAKVTIGPDHEPIFGLERV